MTAVLSGVYLTADAQQRITWPRTFSGQPDFDFVYDDVVEERVQKYDEGEDVIATTTNWETLLTTEGIDPFEPPYPKKKEGDGTDIEFEPAETSYATSFDTNGVNLLNLSALGASNTIDVSEFKSFLGNVISKAVRKAPPHFEELNMQAEISRIVVQTIATSPVKYAMINGRRYTEGSVLNLPVYLIARTEDIVKEVDLQMPNPAQLGAQTQKTYKAIRDEVIKDFVQDRNKRPNAYKAKHMLQVEIVEIKRRQVIIKVLEKTYDIIFR